MDSVQEAHGGVQPVLEALRATPAEIAPSTYYARKSRPASPRSIRDKQLTERMTQVHEENMEVYGARRVGHEMTRQGHDTARCTVERLVRAGGLRGVLRDKHPRTTWSTSSSEVRSRTDRAREVGLGHGPIEHVSANRSRERQTGSNWRQ